MIDFIRLETNPPPPGAEVFMFEATDGAALRGAYFPIENARAAVVLVTGWSEFIEKYFEVVGDLHRRGFAVAMMDWRGQGLSDRASPQANHWRGYFDLLKEDLRLFTDLYVKQRFGGPFVLMTHSMGGLPGLILLAEGGNRFARAILIAPMTRLFAGVQNDVFAAAAKLISWLGLAQMPVAGSDDDAFEFEGNMFTSDRTRHERFRNLQLAEPKAALTRPTYGWVREATKAAAKIHAPGYFDKLKTPVLMVSAGDEQRICGADHANVAAANDLIRQIEIRGALHEILVERDEIRNQFWSAFDDFVAPVFDDIETGARL